jgi:hypothetical protein
VIAYLKCPEDLVKYYESFGASVISKIEEKGWGIGAVMATELYFDDLKNVRKITRRQNRKSDAAE